MTRPLMEYDPMAWPCNQCGKPQGTLENLRRHHAAEHPVRADGTYDVKVVGAIDEARFLRLENRVLELERLHWPRGERHEHDVARARLDRAAQEYMDAWKAVHPPDHATTLGERGEDSGATWESVQ